jgi:hypothetical protein
VRHLVSEQAAGEPGHGEGHAGVRHGSVTRLVGHRFEGLVDGARRRMADSLGAEEFAARRAAGKAADVRSLIDMALTDLAGEA